MKAKIVNRVMHASASTSQPLQGGFSASGGGRATISEANRPGEPGSSGSRSIGSVPRFGVVGDDMVDNVRRHWRQLSTITFVISPDRGYPANLLCFRAPITVEKVR